MLDADVAGFRSGRVWWSGPGPFQCVGADLLRRVGLGDAPIAIGLQGLPSTLSGACLTPMWPVSVWVGLVVWTGTVPVCRCRSVAQGGSGRCSHRHRAARICHRPCQVEWSFRLMVMWPVSFLGPVLAVVS